MGWCNSVPIFQGDVAFIFQDEIDVVEPFMDDAPVRGPPTRYETRPYVDDPDIVVYETHLENSGIRRFVWEHLVDVNRILHRIKHSGAAVSVRKLNFCVPEALILGHLCTYEGYKADPSKIDKIVNWPVPTDLRLVRGFLGTVGVVQKYIKNCAAISRPLTDLTKKENPFEWTPACNIAFNELKSRIASNKCLTPIDYKSSNEVIMAVDSSNKAVGIILCQLDDLGRRRVALYGSIVWNERESKYSQAKIELYGLFRALKYCKYYIIGLSEFVVEMDASYIRGMLNHPDIHPNATINRWIAGILLFDFKLRHVRAEDHKGPDGLSRRPYTQEDTVETEDIEQWLDDALGLGIWISSGMEFTQGDWSYAPRFASGDQAAIRSSSSRVFALVADDETHPSNSESSPRASLPMSEATLQADHELESIKQFLITTERPDGYDDQDFVKLIKKSSKYFYQSDELWR